MIPAVIALHWVFGLPLWGTGLWARYLYLIIMALLSAVVGLVLFKRLSRQKHLARLRNRIRGNIIQLSIYPDQFGIVLASLGAVLADTARSLAESVLPLLVISLPLSVIMLEVNNHCGSEPLAPGGEFVIHAVVDADAQIDAIDIGFSTGIEPVTPVLRIPGQRTVYRRARIIDTAHDTDSFLHLTGAGDTVQVPIAAAHRLKRFAPRTVRPSVPDGLVSNANGFLPADGPVESVSIEYDRAAYPVFWWHLDALVLYVILTMIAAIIIKPLVGVQF